jgi:hypothetical protein
MDIFFADDSVQAAPSREAMGRIVSVGGIYVPSASVNALERSLNDLCTRTGFPPGEEFKWSPGREDWMRQGLVMQARHQFFLSVINQCADNRVRVVVAISDTLSKHPRTCGSHEDFAVQMLIERIQWLASRAGQDVIVVFDRPGGAQAQEETFLARCLETIQEGTPFVRPDRIALNALSTSSHFVRLLQAADLFNGVCTSFVAGEARYSPPLAAAIHPLLANEGRIGGIGVKIHPDFWYTNLYHWLFGDEYYWRGNIGHPLPLVTHPYRRNANQR